MKRLVILTVIFLLIPLAAMAQTSGRFPPFPDNGDKYSQDEWGSYSLAILNDLFSNFSGKQELMANLSVTVKDDVSIRDDSLQHAGLTIRKDESGSHYFLYFGRRFVNKLQSPDEFAAFLAHEFGHVMFSPLHSKEAQSPIWKNKFEEEYPADLVASIVVPRGACHMANIFRKFEVLDEPVNQARSNILINRCKYLSALKTPSSTFTVPDSIPTVPNKESSNEEKANYYRLLLLWAYPQYSEFINKIEIALISDYMEIYACPGRVSFCEKDIIFIPWNFFTLYSGKPEHTAPALGHELGHLVFDRNYWEDSPYSLETHFLQFPGLESRMFQEMEADLFVLLSSRQPSCEIITTILTGTSRSKIYLNTDAGDRLKKISRYRFDYLKVFCR